MILAKVPIGPPTPSLQAAKWRSWRPHLSKCRAWSLILKCSSKHNPPWISWKIESLEVILTDFFGTFVVFLAVQIEFSLPIDAPQYDSLSLAFSSSKPQSEYYTRSILNKNTQKCTRTAEAALESFLKCIKAFLPPSV